MRIFLIFLLFISASLLAWVEYLRRHPEEAFWNKPHITQQAEAQAEGTEASPSPAQAEPTDALVEEAPNELQTIEEEYVQQMREYWYALLDTDRDWNSPAKRTDLAREIHFLTNLGVEESITYWELLQQMPPEFAEDKDAIATAIINNVAMRDPVEAVSMLLASGEAYPNLDYPMIVRLWMDEEGTSIMDWVDDMDAMGANEQLQNAFYRVYAEEDPQSLLSLYGQRADPASIDAAIDAIYSQYGANTLNEIARHPASHRTLEAAFARVATSLQSDDPDRAQQFILTNRFQVSESSVSTVAKNYIEQGRTQGAEAMETALNWTLNNSLIQAESPELTSILSDTWAQDPELATHLITSLVNRTGVMQDDWAAILAGTDSLQRFTVTADEVTGGSSSATTLEELSPALSAVTRQFLEDVGMDPDDLNFTYTIDEDLSDQENLMKMLEILSQETTSEEPKE